MINHFFAFRMEGRMGEFSAASASPFPQVWLQSG